MLTLAEFDSNLLERIKANPNPRSLIGLVRRSIAWGRSLDKKIAFESARNMFAIVGVTGYAGFLSGMHIVLATFSFLLMAGTWYSVYLFLYNKQ
jgi:hypothetical protein